MNEGPLILDAMHGKLMLQLNDNLTRLEISMYVIHDFIEDINYES